MSCTAPASTAKKLTPGYAANAKLLEALPAEVTSGLMSYAPSPDLGKPGL